MHSPVTAATSGCSRAERKHLKRSEGLSPESQDRNLVLTALYMPNSLDSLHLRALPTETKVESGTSKSKSGTSVDLSNGKNQ